MGHNCFVYAIKYRESFRYSAVVSDVLTADDLAFAASVASTGRDVLTSLDFVRPQQLTAAGRVDAVTALEKLIGWAQPSSTACWR